MKEAFGNRLINIRNPWGSFEWSGDWADRSSRWDEQMLKAVQPVLNEHDGTFWMSYEDFTANFSSITVCRVGPYYESRVHGFFERQIYNSNEWIVSKYYY